MLLDSQEVFSAAQAVTSTAISTNVLDTNVTQTANLTSIDFGTGEELYLFVKTNTTCTDSGSDATLTLTLESDSTADLATSPTVHYSTGAIAFATYATAGSIVAAIRLPAGAYERYLGVRYTIASGPLTAGKFDAFLVKDIQKYTNYASGFTVS